MTFDEAMRAAARTADQAVDVVMKRYASRNVYDEDDISPYLLGALDVTFNANRISGLQWSATILRHRKGKAAEEKRIGADYLIHVKLRTNTHNYSKGVLVQAKKIGPNHVMFEKARAELTTQCNKMLRRTPAAFVFDYAAEGMRCAAATKIAGSKSTDLYRECGWTSYRFFRELFRCPIGDPRITSDRVDRLPVSGGISLSGEGDLEG